MIPKTFLLCAVPASLLVSGMLGCTKDDVVVPPTVSVHGTVMYKDKPLTDATVTFVSKLDNKDVRPASGTTDASGEFSLSTYLDPEHEVSGATPGDYIVTIHKVEQIDPERRMREFKTNPNMTFKKLIPDKYTESTTSPLKATVSMDGENSFDFVLKD